MQLLCFEMQKTTIDYGAGDDIVLFCKGIPHYPHVDEYELFITFEQQTI